MTDADLHKLQEDVAEIKAMLRQLLHPAASLSVKEKAAAVSRAVATGDRKVLRETLKQINGE